jgi:hypothetical protein
MATKKVENQGKGVTIDVTPITVTVPRQYDIEIMGMGGLLMNHMPDFSISKVSKPNQARVDPAERELKIWREKLYVDSANQVFIPGENIHECLFEGTKYWGERIAGEGKKTYTDLVKSGCVAESLYLGMDKDDERIVQFGKMVCVSKTNRSRIYRVRPLIQPWGGTFRLHVFDDRLTSDVLKTIVTYAGTFKGICDWRPVYGRFNLVGLREA